MGPSLCPPLSRSGHKRPLLQPHPHNIEPLSKRFRTLSNEELENISKPFVPKNTETSTRWALENFHCWLKHRNSTAKEDEDKCPVTLLEDMDSEQLNKWLSAYVAETRKVNGEPYPPSTLQSLLSGLLRHMRAIDEKRAPNIFAKGNPAFKQLHCIMDAVYKQLRSDGIGAETHSAQPFSKEDENQLWEQGVDSPHALL